MAEFKRDQVDHSRQQPPPPPIHVARTGQAEYNIERIAGWRQWEGAAEFEVKWEGYAEADNTWEPHTNLTRFGRGSRELFKKFVDDTNDRCLRRLLPRAYGGRARSGGGGRTRGQGMFSISFWFRKRRFTAGGLFAGGRWL